MSVPERKDSWAAGSVGGGGADEYFLGIEDEEEDEEADEEYNYWGIIWRYLMEEPVLERAPLRTAGLMEFLTSHVAYRSGGRELLHLGQSDDRPMTIDSNPSGRNYL